MTSTQGVQCPNEAQSIKLGLCTAHKSRIARWGHVGRDIPIRAYIRVAEISAPKLLEGSTDEEKFWSGVSRTSDHWLWIGGTCKSNGLGQLSYNGYNQTAGRVAWLVAFGDLPKGTRVASTCGEKLCVRISHLQVTYLNGEPYMDLSPIELEELAGV
ncbi:hypothetical protein [Streptomyces sp. YPW6]|uniref:hypothetical protein n=1 Tax=Streptomyces sp. YPW6 TaxID=2840373 RepID=UPI003D704326